MTNIDLCSMPSRSNFFDVKSESVTTACTNDNGEQDSFPFPSLPNPTPTDLGTLFLGRKTKSRRRHDPGHVPRPRNAFILFRCDFVRQRVPDDIISDHRDVSRLAGCMWRKMSDDQKRPWFEKAEEERVYHSQIFPSYRYTPGPMKRPKRIYKRKKTPSPKEVFLRDPRDIGERDNFIPTAKETASKMAVHQHKFRLAPSSMHRDHASAKESRHSRAYYQSYGSFNDTETKHSSLIPDREYSHSSPIDPFSDGFTQMPKPNDTFNWSFDQPGSSSYNQQGCYQWHSRISEVYSPNFTHTPYTTYSPDSTSASTSSQSTDSLYDMWRGLNDFHSYDLMPAHYPPSHSLTHTSQDVPYIPSASSQNGSYYSINSVHHSPAWSP